MSATEHPSLRAVLGHLALSLLLANVIPATLFYVCYRADDIAMALIVALAWCYGSIAWRVATRRRSSGLLWLTVIGLTVKTAVALATGSTFLYFLQPALTDTAVAAVFLVSLATARPVVARLASDFYPMSRDVASRPRIQRLFWGLTLLWGGICLARATATIWLLHVLPMASFITVKTVVSPTVAVAGATVTVILATRVARREGLLPHGRAIPAA
jgi:hypothetical protein